MDSPRSLLLHPLVLPCAVTLVAYDALLGFDLIIGRSEAAPAFLGVLLLAVAALLGATTGAAAAAAWSRPVDGSVPASARWLRLASAWPVVLLGAGLATGVLALAGVHV
ncbi:hypothetical protein KLP28_10525 [Nocardioidaceae bacterium]|nr:hypothetical protein KLP28_10525 [Nocardioidaceae bacterium]